MDLSLVSLIILSLSFSLSRKEDKISETIPNFLSLPFAKMIKASHDSSSLVVARFLFHEIKDVAEEPNQIKFNPIRM